MIFHLAAMVFITLIAAKVCQLIKLPPLLGMLLVGMALGRYSSDLWSGTFLESSMAYLRMEDSLLSLSDSFRTLALVLILTRAGLGIRKDDLLKVGRPAFLMSWLPALCEGLVLSFGVMVMFSWPWMEAVLLACVLSAVSPAVIVPKMLKLTEMGLGMKHKLPVMILAGASLDDLLALACFGLLIQHLSAASMNANMETSLWFSLGSVVWSLLSGLATGYLLARLAIGFYRRFCPWRGVEFSLLLLCVLVQYYALGKQSLFPICSLLGLMFFGFSLLRKDEVLAKKVAGHYQSLWVGAECLLFLMIGAEVNPRVLLNLSGVGILLLLLGLAARSCGVWLSLLRTPFERSEKLFAVIAFWPKATVQAAIGGVALSVWHAGECELWGGEQTAQQILSMAVLAILLTAPLGAWLMDHLENKLLNSDAEA